MAQNMDYCKFENTLAALRECGNDFYEPETLSKSESEARYDMLQLMKELVNDLLDD